VRACVCVSLPQSKCILTLTLACDYHLFSAGLSGGSPAHHPPGDLPPRVQADAAVHERRPGQETQVRHDRPHPGEDARQVNHGAVESDVPEKYALFHERLNRLTLVLCYACNVAQNEYNTTTHTQAMGGGEGCITAAYFLLKAIYLQTTLCMFQLLHSECVSAFGSVHHKYNSLLRSLAVVAPQGDTPWLPSQ